MIVPMIKYAFILYHSDYESFLEKLQELGLVDVTVRNWEPNERERQLMADLDLHRRAMSELAALRKKEGRKPAQPFDSSEESFRNYAEATVEIDRLKAAIARTEKEAQELRPWGEFSPDEVARLRREGVVLHFYTAYAKEFERHEDAWREEYVLEKVAEGNNGLVYFVVITGPDAGPVTIDAQEVKAPEANHAAKEAELERLRKELETQQARLERSAENLEDLAELGARMREDLHLSRVSTSAPREAEGTLVVLEGWATKETQEKVDAFLAQDDTAYFFKGEPTAEDDPPVLLKNNRFARLFEVIGGLYALPKYGTMDLTPYYAPFYMLFFGFCLADAGYGLLYIVGALIARWKLAPKYKPFASLILLCGISTVLFGLLTGNVFGIQLAEQSAFARFQHYFLTSDNLFMLAIAVGLVQILFGLVLKAIFRGRTLGWKYSFSTFGWIVVIVSSLAAFVLPKVGIESYTFSSPLFWVVTGIGLLAMLFLNSPGKNPFVNFGLGLWNTYNDLTGLMSDTLSYIRLFALGLSGSILALVFNRLALGMSPDIVVLKQIVMIIILALGQGLTLFMSSLSAFVHPLRLTFVEFYRNAGFEPGGRPFDPLKKESKKSLENV